MVSWRLSFKKGRSDGEYGKERGWYRKEREEVIGRSECEYKEERGRMQESTRGIQDGAVENILEGATENIRRGQESIYRKERGIVTGMPFTSNTATVLSKARRSPDSLAFWNLSSTRSGRPSGILIEPMTIWNCKFKGLDWSYCVI
jgi:MoaA/NifB/PqqE/SkfB family radical SAM enzyme